MKRISTMMLGGLLAVAASAAPIAVAAKSIVTPAGRVLPVLVYVNSAGKITSVVPATRISPKLEDLLRKNLDEMIVKPAMHNGHPVASQFVMNVKLDVGTQTQDGYDAKFTYVSSSPIPAGRWHWVDQGVQRGQRFALASDATGIPRPPVYQPSFTPKQQLPSTPPTTSPNPPAQSQAASQTAAVATRGL